MAKKTIDQGWTDAASGQWHRRLRQGLAHKVVKVGLAQHPSPKEDDQGDQSDDAHVADDVLDLVLDAPKDDGGRGDGQDEPLNGGEGVLWLPHRVDDGASTAAV